MSHYHDSDDLVIPGEIKRLAPADFEGFVALDKGSAATTERSRTSIAS